MKILLVGVCDDKESTNYHQLVALQQLGHEVVPFNYRTVTQQHEGCPDKLETIYKEALEGVSPQLVIFSKFNDWPSDMIEWARERATTLFWYMDPLFGLSYRLVNHALAADFASATGLAQVEYMRAMGANAYHILEGVDPDVYYPVERGEKMADVGFVGAITPERKRLCGLLHDRGLEVLPTGPGWGTQDKVDAEKFRKLCAGCTVMLGRDREILTPGYFSDRAFRVMACGGVYATVAAPGTEKWLVDGENCLTASSDEELVDVIEHAMGGYDWQVIRNRGREFVLGGHTWKHSMSRLLKIVENG